LYGLDRARTALRQGARLLVVEGYMDVIALHEAGFGGRGRAGAVLCRMVERRPAGRLHLRHGDVLNPFKTGVAEAHPRDEAIPVAVRRHRSRGRPIASAARSD
jgi:hypothetical protein